MSLQEGFAEKVSAQAALRAPTRAEGSRTTEGDPSLWYPVMTPATTSRRSKGDQSLDRRTRASILLDLFLEVLGAL
eukprot:15935094-Heterocapsa_arctica.AAC.1